MRRARFLQQGFLAIDASFFGVEFDVTEPAPFKQIGSAAVVEIRGPLTQHPCWFWDDYESIKERAAKAFASSCTDVVLKIDSPGGDAAGAFDLSRSIRKMSEQSGKRLFAYADGKALSAGYAIACAAGRIVLSETSSAGSIGCIATLLDVTAADKMYGLAFAIVASGKRKADGNPHTPLSDDALKACQGQIDAIAAVFFELVAGARRVSPGAIRSLEAATFIGKDAESVGLADAVLSFDDFIAELGEKTTAVKGGAEENMLGGKHAKSAIKAGDDKEEDDKDKKEEKSESDDKKCAKCETSNDADASFCKKCGAKLGKEDAKADDKKDDDKNDDKDEKAEAVSGLALAAKVQSLAVRLDAREEAEERKTLLASRPDLDASVVAFLNRAPLAQVRDAVKTFERRAVPKGQIAAARAALDPGVQATRGEEQLDAPGTPSRGHGGDHSKEKLDEAMGLAPPVSAIKHEGTRLYLGVLTPEQSRAITAAREKEAAAKAAAPKAATEGR